MNPQLRILVVDDDKRMTRTLADILFISGYAPVEASSGLEALEKARTLPFDCVLTDVRMPDMDGVELHRRLRQVQPGLPVVLMTAYSAEERLRQGLEEGVVGVLDKPLDINQILGFFASLSKNRTIVMVDDDPIFCKTLGDLLQRRGFSVKHFTNPHTDVELMTMDAQIILLDMKLKNTNGLEVLKSIRGRCPTLPVLLVTAYRQEMAETIQAAMEINAYACLYKPLEIPALLQILAQLQLDNLRDILKGKKNRNRSPSENQNSV